MVLGESTPFPLYQKNQIYTYKSNLLKGIIMKKRFCEECEKEIDSFKGWIKINFRRLERDYGMEIAQQLTRFRGYDFCSPECAIEFLKKEE